MKVEKERMKHTGQEGTPTFPEAVEERMVVLWSQTIQKANYESKTMVFCSWFRSNFSVYVH